VTVLLGTSSSPPRPTRPRNGIWLPGRTRRLFALVANYGPSSVTPLDLTNPLAPVASAAVAVGATPYCLGAFIYYR